MDNSTIARPYARAVFERARETGRLGQWSDTIAIAAAGVKNATLRGLLEDPRCTPDRQAELLLRLYEDEPGGEAHNLFRLLAHNDRLLALPEIAEIYEDLRAEAEGTLDVQLVSVEPVGSEEQSRVAAALKRRLGVEIELENVIDPALLGGVVIRAGDLVIDGSVRGRLESLAASLKR